jgi:hypothetical protein
LKINILTSQTIWARGFNDFFPLMKWKEALKQEGFEFEYLYHHQNKSIFNCDMLWIEYRYFFRYFDTTDHNVDISPVIDFFILAKSKVGFLVLFDSSDSTGSQCLILTQFVDLHLKKQLYKDLNKYTIDNGDKGFMCWIQDDATPSNIKYYTTNKDQLHKFKISWNIGLVDYRNWPLSRYYPIGTSPILSGTYKHINFIPASGNRDLLTTYRGSISTDTRYSFQRSKLLELLQKKNLMYPIKVGRPISKAKYLNEMARSKFLFSPFGWGEICYRDFEILLSGSTLVKPSMEHLNTFPQYYFPQQTYVPLKWDMSDAEQVLESLASTDNEKLQIMAKNGQEIFLESQKSALMFISHFKNMLSV